MIQAILTDIEGTLSSLSFTREVLFPYAARRLPDFVRENGREPEVKRLLADVRAYAGRSLDDEALIERMLAWMEVDQKITPLKALQGLIWEEGFGRGDFTGHVHADAVDCLRRWHDSGMALYVFSSGSVHTQQMLLGHSQAGDLRPLFTDHFDTRVGGKKQIAAYKTIAERIAIPPGRILFLSDTVDELDAAGSAGLRTTCIRRADDPRDAGGHPCATDFYGVEVNGDPSVRPVEADHAGD
ncbi:acireductone synthase [Ectothiorhodospira marina]|jgi:enolase-phosphatase E1|uniref:Enolase-phosphatase E1 n=1 Tax=Ectothiorhodospira marina TaxID=1396821 RepID=A0A1H7P1H1_9GAMM|nr:acireductone synthase [Ectothiorhodospira marina]SEL29653.1 enolase-phosphatase E1 [Ectothiorhodospira marina]